MSRGLGLLLRRLDAVGAEMCPRAIEALPLEIHLLRFFTLDIGMRPGRGAVGAAAAAFAGS